MNESGTRRQRWETFATHKEALRRKAEVENHINEGTFVAPSNQTVAAFLEDFVSLCGESRWGVSAYGGNTGLIRNYINPLIGNELVQNITPKFVDLFTKKPVSIRNRCPKTEFVANATIEKTHKLWMCAFIQAIWWELVARNPFEFAMIPKTSCQNRDI